jgi:DegV family protein with EDD domain
LLSVLREWSEEASRASSKSQDFAHILGISYPRAVSALKRTPDQLEVLKKNKVVDAGGKAFVYFLEGILDLVEKGDVDRSYFGKIFSKVDYVQESATSPYCVEFCVNARNLDRKNLIDRVKRIGQDLIFYGAAHFAKLHINTNNPEAVIACASQFGKISSKKIFQLSSDPEMQELQPTCLAADSTCDLKDSLIEKNDVYFIPIKVQTDDKIYTDRWDIIPEEFYPILDSSSSLPKTSQPSLMDFTRIYRHLLLHYRSIISVHLSKALSGTFLTAVQASQNVHPERIMVVDGKNLSVGLGLVLLEGIRAIKHGKNPEDAEHQIKNAARNTQIFIGLPTLKYLVKGGRITKTKGIIANMLNINPILSIGPEGKLIPVSKARGRKNLEQKTLDLAYRRAQKSPGRFSLAVAHTNAPEIGARIAQEITTVFGQEAELVMNASPALGAHAGPRAFGIAVRNRFDQSPSSSDNNTNT